MNLTQQVVSLPLAKRLKELGVKQESYFIWASLEQGEEVFFPTTQDEIDREHDRYATTGGGHQYEVHCAAFTVAELGEALQKAGPEKMIKAYGDVYSFEGTGAIGAIGVLRLLTNPDRLASMLIHLIENNLITP